MSLILEIPPQKTFDLPIGNYRGALFEYKTFEKQTKKGQQQWIRFVFVVKVPGMPDKIPCAGRNFVINLNAGSDLMNFLSVWFDQDMALCLSGKSLDMDTLRGKEGDIVLNHFVGDGYAKPHVRIEAVYPMGTLELEPELEGKANEDGKTKDKE